MKVPQMMRFLASDISLGLGESDAEKHLKKANDWVLEKEDSNEWRSSDWALVNTLARYVLHILSLTISPF